MASPSGQRCQNGDFNCGTTVRKDVHAVAQARQCAWAVKRRPGDSAKRRPAQRRAAAVVQYRALKGGWKEKKLSGYDKLSGLGDTRVNNCTVLIFNYLILFS